MLLWSKSENLALFLLGLSLLVNLALHGKHLTQDLRGIHLWRQSQTMWNVRNFARHDANILNPRVSHFNGGKDNIYRYEFPLMQWTIGIAERLFGEHILLVRLMVFLMGALSVLAFFGLLRALSFKPPEAAFTAVLYSFSPVLFYYIINPLPDILALSGGMGYLYFIVSHRKSGGNKKLILASICLCIATLAKLPYLMFSIVSIYYFLRDFFGPRGRGKQDKAPLTNSRWIGAGLSAVLLRQAGGRGVNWKLIKFAGWQLLILVPAFAWYAWVMPGWQGNGILYGIFGEGMSWDETMAVFTFYANTSFPDELLNAGLWLPFLIGLFTLGRSGVDPWLVGSLAGITFLYLLLEYNMIVTVHDYYLMPFLPWLFLVVGAGVRQVARLPSKFGYPILGLILIGTIWQTMSYTKDYWSVEKSYFNPDVFTYQEELQNAVPDTSRVIMLNDPSQYILSYQIDKMGFVFGHDMLPAGWVEDMILNYGVRYMYSDSRPVDESPEILPMIDTMLLEAGSIRVFQLVLAAEFGKE